MKLENLVGKLAIRTKPVELGRDFSGVKQYDYSYTESPIKILKVTDSHIIYTYQNTTEEKIFGTKKNILNERWLDDNWTDYEELIGD